MASLHGPTPRQRTVRWALAVGYAALVALGFVAPWQPRVFWTILLPALPIAIVLMGFPNWRNVCPLALFGEAGRRLNRGAQRRVPAWLERRFFPFTFAILLAMLVLRLVATNGDGRWLAGLLVALALAAVAVNLVYTGKSWCNFFCPVGFVERVYTEPNSLLAKRSSQCAQCTACKKHCPDIDQENAYWKDVSSGARRAASYAFPGLVFAFYCYYWLREGEWAAYFDGRWTRHPFAVDMVTGPGFFFAPRVPAVVAATLTLVGFSLASLALFAAVEALCRRGSEDTEKLRHRMLAVAAFSAFSIFYVYAGAPTLRELSGGTQAVAFVAPMLGTVFLAKRWRRSREHFIGDQGVKRLLRNWPFDEPPPSDAAEVYGFIKASEHARDKELEAYASTVRDMIADGLVGPGELRLLEGVRKRLGVSETEHEKIFARLNQEERHLFEGAGGIEARAQLEGYRAALTEALLRGAAQSQIDELRESFGVSLEDHQRTLERTRGASGDLLARARRQLDRALAIREDLAAIGATEPTAARVFLATLLRKSRTEALHRVLELLEVAGDGPMIQGLRSRLFSRDAQRRRMALELLAQACPGAETLAEDLDPLLADRPPPLTDIDAAPRETAILLRLMRDPNPFRRAAAVWAACSGDDPPLRDAVAESRADEHPLVAETAARFAGARATAPTPAPTLSTIETMHFLYAVPLFANLEPEDLYEIALFAFEQTIEPPAVICQAGDPRSDALYVILAGTARVELPGEGGEIVAGELLGPGKVVGELSVLDGNPRSATVRPTDGPVRVLRVAGQPFRSGVLRRQHIAQSIFGALTAQIRELARQLGRP